MDYQDYDVYILTKKIEELESGFREDILFDDDKLKNSRFFLPTLQFFAEDGMLMLADNHANIMSIREMKKLISYLNYTVDNFNEKESINKELIKHKKSLKDILEYKPNQKEKIAKIGEVYLIEGENGRYKIGFSKNAKSRVEALRLSSCEDHKLVHKFKAKNPYEKEQELHLLFAEKRNHSEWFTLDEKDVKYIKGLSDEI